MKKYYRVDIVKEDFMDSKEYWETLAYTGAENVAWAYATLYEACGHIARVTEVNEPNLKPIKELYVR